MNSSGAAEELPLNFEREEGWQNVTVTVESLGRKVFAADGMLVELLKKMRTALSARGPDPDYPEQDDDIRRLAHIIERLANRPPPNMNNGDDSSDIKKWIAGLGVILTAGFIAGAWTLSNQVASQTVKIEHLTDQMKEQNARITRIEQQANERR